MSKILFLYSTYEGQTKKIIEHIASGLNEYEASYYQFSELPQNLDLTQYDRIVLGSSIRYGHFSRHLYQFLKANQVVLETMKERVSFFGVNLTARKAEKNTPETNAYMKKFVQRAAWTPPLLSVFAGALYYPRYSFFDRIMIQLIMKITKGETDPNKEVEYTDWNKVDKFVKLIKQG